MYMLYVYNSRTCETKVLELIPTAIPTVHSHADDGVVDNDSFAAKWDPLIQVYQNRPMISYHTFL